MCCVGQGAWSSILGMIGCCHGINKPGLAVCAGCFAAHIYHQVLDQMQRHATSGILDKLLLIAWAVHLQLGCHTSQTWWQFSHHPPYCMCICVLLVAVVSHCVLGGCAGCSAAPSSLVMTLKLHFIWFALGCMNMSLCQLDKLGTKRDI